MKRFRQFAEHNRGLIAVPDSLLEAIDAMDFLTEAKIKWNKNEEYWTHDHNIGDHEVQVHIERMPFETKERKEQMEHSFSFTVGGKFSKHKINTDDGKAILHHVGKVVHEYIKKNTKRGDEVFLKASDKDSGALEKKDKIYGAFARRIANHVGGDYHHNKDMKSHHIYL